MNEQLKFILGSMRDLCKSAIEKSTGDPMLYARFDELYEDITALQKYLERDNA